MPIKLDVDFSLLDKAVKAMGAEELVVLFEKLKKEKGIPVSDLSDVEPINGLLSYKGYQIILYIQDHTHHTHRNMFEEAIEDGSEGNKFHVAECKTIQNMRFIKRFERYVITNNQSGKFTITGRNDERREAELQVCRNCLEKLNYAGFRDLKNESKKGDIVKEFHLPIFFETYASCFSTLPSRRAGVREDYTDDWLEVSWSYRKKQNFTCEKCRVNLKQLDHHKLFHTLLHTHHKSGVKTRNREENLQALCAYCHSRQPGHQHMKNEMFRKSFEQINQLRREQGLPQFDLPQEELF